MLKRHFTTSKMPLYKSKMKPLQSMNTMSNKGNEGGRPLKEVADMQESGEKSREYKENRVGEK